jgi:hypothetical protein
VPIAYNTRRYGARVQYLTEKLRVYYP